MLCSLRAAALCRLLCVFFPIVVLWAGCASPDKASDAQRARSVRNWSLATEAAGGAAVSSQIAVVDLVRLATADFSLDPRVDLAPETAVGPFTDKLLAAARAQVGLLTATHELAYWAGQARLLEGDEASSVTRGAVGMLKQRLIGLLIIAAGVGLTGWGAYKGTKKAVKQRAEPVAAKIKEATAQELKVINESLGLPPDTDQDSTLAHFDELGVSDTIEKTKLVQANLEDAEADGAVGVTGVDPTATRRSIARAAVTVGETGLKTQVSLATAATGGQGYVQAAEVLGMTATGAAVADLTITAVSTATDVPLQPLDVLAASMTSVTVSKASVPDSIPPVAERLDREEALDLLGNTSATCTEEDAASNSLALMALEAGVGAGVIDGAESVAVDLPERVHLTQLTDPKALATIGLPQMPGDGRADLLLAADGMLPVVYENIDTTDAIALTYALTALPEDPNAPIDDPGTDPSGADGMLAALNACKLDGGDFVCKPPEETKWRCVSFLSICDGIVDCTNGDVSTDELYCDPEADPCPSGSFDCASGGHILPGNRCLSQAQRCDGFPSCPIDGADERGCGV